MLVFSLSACKNKKESISSDTTSKITEKDIFEYNGTESEYKITTSEAEELFGNQSNASAVSSEDAATESDKEETSSQSETLSESNESTDSSIEAESKPQNMYDKDGDGWTDEWK